MTHFLICSFPFSGIKKILKIKTVPYLFLETPKPNAEGNVMDFQEKMQNPQMQRGEENEAGSSKS